MLTSSYYTPAAATTAQRRWLLTPSFSVTSPDMVIQWDDNDLGSGEPISVYVSSTAGTTIAAFGSTPIYHAPCTAGGVFGTHQVPLTAYNGMTIRVAFVDDTVNNWALGLDNVQTTILSAYDVSVNAIYLNPFVQTGSSNTVTGNLHNAGVTTITGFRLNYSVNGGAAVQNYVSGVSVPLGGDYTYTATAPWVPATSGTYTIKVWADSLNGGNMDANHANDTSTTSVLVIDTLQPKKVLIEEFNQASCDPCAEATENVDSVHTNNLSRTSMVRYHVNFPGRDCMDSVTLNPFVQARLTYYNVSGVPDAQVDGYYVYPGAGYLTTDIIGQAAAVGSPVSITVTPSYNASTHTFTVSSTIKSYGALPSGLKAYAALTIDTIKYHANQSTESIPQYSFPEVAENMFPNSGGTTLSAFTSGSTQTLNLTWVKNHPWGSDYAVWAYDSSITGKVVVWVEDDAKQYVYQSASAPVSTLFSSAVNNVTAEAGSFNVYPNPASNTATVAVNLVESADVKIEIYNAVGQMVFAMPTEHRDSGSSSAMIDLAGYASGQYVVRATINGQVFTQKLTVIK